MFEKFMTILFLVLETGALLFFTRARVYGFIDVILILMIGLNILKIRTWFIDPKKSAGNPAGKTEEQPAWNADGQPAAHAEGTPAGAAPAAVEPLPPHPGDGMFGEGASMPGKGAGTVYNEIPEPGHGSNPDDIPTVMLGDFFPAVPPADPAAKPAEQEVLSADEMEAYRARALKMMEEDPEATLRICSRCGQGYPFMLPRCPHCGQVSGGW